MTDMLKQTKTILESAKSVSDGGRMETTPAPESQEVGVLQAVEKKNMFVGCCTADSQTDTGRHQLYNNCSLVFPPLLGLMSFLLPETNIFQFSH